jgi:hypothetical protein
MTVAQTSWDIMLEANTNWHNSSLSSDYAQAREITENIEIKYQMKTSTKLWYFEKKTNKKRGYGFSLQMIV